MPDKPSNARPSHAANIVKRGELYHLLMLVEGRWLETGITSRKFLEITRIADREFSIVHVNAPLDAPPPVMKGTTREGAGEKAPAAAKASDKSSTPAS